MPTLRRFGLPGARTFPITPVCPWALRAPLADAGFASRASSGAFRGGLGLISGVATYGLALSSASMSILPRLPSPS
eukprot:15086505-Alexandrium_andersonii.AAC.1